MTFIDFTEADARKSVRRPSLILVFALACVGCDATQTAEQLNGDLGPMAMDAAPTPTDVAVVADMGPDAAADERLDAAPAADSGPARVDAAAVEDAGTSVNIDARAPDDSGSAPVDAAAIEDAAPPVDIDAHSPADSGPAQIDAAVVEDASGPDEVDAGEPALPCDGLADGTVVVEGVFGDCRYAGQCAENGQRSRVNAVCENGALVERDDTTADGCARETEARILDTGAYDGDCVYADVCAIDGTQTRINRVCEGGLPVEFVETTLLEACRRGTDGNPCGEDGRACDAGACACPADRPTLCGQRCVDLTDDVEHCGACEARCGPGLECVAGECIGTCGNGRVDAAAGEACDDGNDDPRDGCHQCRGVAAEHCLERVCDALGTAFEQAVTPISVPHPLAPTVTVTPQLLRNVDALRVERPGDPPRQRPTHPGFGQAVAIDGDWAMVGAPDGLVSDEMGDVYFFQRRAGVWHPHTRMTVDPSRPACESDCQWVCERCEELRRVCDDNGFSDEECDMNLPPDCFGLEGRCGAACYRGIGWCANSHQFGRKIGLSGDHAVVWSWHSYSEEFEYDYTPLLYVYRLTDDAWTPTGILRPFRFGAEREWANALAIDGQTIVTGPRSIDDEALVFEIIDGHWAQSQQLAPDVPAEGRGFGQAVDISGDRVVVGAWRSQAAYVFSRTDNGWQQSVRLTREVVEDGARFGWRVAIEDTTVIVGHGQDAHSTVVFGVVEGQWREIQELPHGGRIHLAGDTLILGGRWIYRRSAGRFALSAHIDPSVIPAVSASQFSGETVILGHAPADGVADPSGSATLVELPVPLCFTDGHCACRPGADGPNCTARPDCGDGVQQAAEACDDGNQDDGDGCSAQCTVELP